jgi:hypothetical protein
VAFWDSLRYNYHYRLACSNTDYVKWLTKWRISIQGTPCLSVPNWDCFAGTFEFIFSRVCMIWHCYSIFSVINLCFVFVIYLRLESVFANLITRGYQRTSNTNPDKKKTKKFNQNRSVCEQMFRGSHSDTYVYITYSHMYPTLNYFWQKSQSSMWIMLCILHQFLHNSVYCWIIIWIWHRICKTAKAMQQ